MHRMFMASMVIVSSYHRIIVSWYHHIVISFHHHIIYIYIYIYISKDIQGRVEEVSQNVLGIENLMEARQNRTQELETGLMEEDLGPSRNAKRTGAWKRY